MLAKIMSGRLGNQMFQYASMRAIQEKIFPDEKINLMFFDIERDGPKTDGFYNQLDMFQINESKTSFDYPAHFALKQKYLILSYFAKRKLIKLTSSPENYEWKKQSFEKKEQKKYNKNGIYIYSYGYYDFRKNKVPVSDKFFLGFYEAAEFFNPIRNIILTELTPKQPPLKKNLKLYEAISSSESVCISIRRGDFLSPRFKKSNYICTPEYFQKAINKANQAIQNPRFVVFSDDIEWVKSNMHFPNNTLYEDGTDPVWEKLRLMYSCKHFIISNSTFSWWAQYLSRNDNKVVIAPSRWRNVGYDGRDLYDKDWILVNI